MSASKDKINRKELREAGQDKRQLAEAKEATEKRKSRIKYITIAVIVVLVFAFIFIYNSVLPSRSLTAVNIDGEQYSVAELNYYYNNSFQTFYNNYYQYVQYGMFFDPNQSLADQQYAEDMTWRDYFIEQAVDTMKQTKALCDAGEAEGFVLNEEYEAQYENAVAELDAAWKQNGYNSLSQFISVVYGKGVDETIVKNELYRAVYASAYAQHIYDSYEYSAEEISAYYAEHANELDYIDYIYYYAVAEEGAEDPAEKFNALAEKVNGTDKASFSAAVLADFDAEVTPYHMQGGSLSEAYAEWLLDSARQPGDATAIATESGWYAVMFLGRDDNNYKPRDFRHILCKAEDSDGDDVITNEDIEAAIAEAYELYDEWQAGAATEDSFMEMVTLYSEDEGSATTGGLYTNTLKGQMVPPVDEWVFAAAEPGETSVVEYNEGGSYSGGHVMYYVGEAERTAAETMAEDDMRGNAATDWLIQAVDGMNATTSNLGIAAKNR